jgi:hypothetical protein
MAKDNFGFADAARDLEVDLAAFEPKAKPVDRKSAQAASEVAQDAGFSRRTTKPREPKPAAAPAPHKGARRRISISEAIGREERYPDSQRAQLNVLAPLPVLIRWRELVKGADAPAWTILEKAMDALAAQNAEDSVSGK